MAIESSSFSLQSVQVVLFTPGAVDDRFRTSDVLANVLPNFAKRYDGEVESTPLQKAPKPIPIGPGTTEIGLRFVASGVTLKSDDEQWVFKASPQRVDSIWTGKSTQSASSELNDICQKCLEPTISYPANRKIQIGRLALVVKRIATLSNSAGALANQFCRPEIVDSTNDRAPLRHSRTFRLDNLKRYRSPLDSLEVNSWVRCHSDRDGDTDAITIEQDINTLHETQTATAFSIDQIQAFFLWAPDELDKILQLYFPATQT